MIIILYCGVSGVYSLYICLRVCLFVLWSHIFSLWAISDQCHNIDMCINVQTIVGSGPSQVVIDPS